MLRILAAATIVISVGPAANADVVGSAPAYGGPTQSTIVCYYSNIGNSSINFSRSTILIEPGDAVTESVEFCIGLIGAGQRCRTVAEPIATNGAHWCRAVVNNKATLRGRMEIRNSSGTVLSTEEIR